MKNELLTICWKASDNVPENLKEERYILPLPKKGDFGQTVNCRYNILCSCCSDIQQNVAKQVETTHGSQVEDKSESIQAKQTNCCTVSSNVQVIGGHQNKNLSVDIH